MRATLLAIFAIVAATTLWPGCDRNGDTDDATETSPEAVEDTDDLVVSGGELEITVDDVEQAVERLRLLAPGVEHGEIPDQSPEWMKAPQAQINVVRNLTHFHVVRLAAAERDIAITPADEVAFLADHDPLSRYLPVLQNGDEADDLRRELEQVGLDVTDVRHLVHDMVLAEKLREELADEFTDEKLWALYQQAHDEADLVVVEIRNTPGSREIDRAVDQYDAEIRAHYRENRSRYQTPKRALVTLLHTDSDREVDVDILEEAAGRLADEAPEALADELDLVVERDVDVTRHENPAAHTSEVGDTGHVEKSRRGAYAWRLDEIHPPETRSLDRPLRRQIASRVLRDEEGITPKNLRRAEEAQQLLATPEPEDALSEDAIEALVERLEEAGFDATHTGVFSLRGRGVIPDIGLAEKLIGAVDDVDLDDPITDPVLERDVVYVARLVDRSVPDRQEFDEKQDQFRKEFLERNRDQLVSDYVANYERTHGVDYSLQPLSERFGIYDKKQRAGEAQ